MTTLLVDGNNILARADFAAKGKHVEMSVNGVNTAALVIFVNLLAKYVRQVRPDSMVVCWDAGHTFRDEVYPEYKAARKKPVEGGGDTIPFALAKEFLTLAGVSHISHDGYEADDLIAAYARQTVQEVVILSGDKDLLQLVQLQPPEYGACTQIRVPDDESWTESRVCAKFGVFPEHLPYYLALVGDVGDGVPGVKGIGPKKACALLEQAEWGWEAVLDLLGPERAAQAVLMRALVDLRYYRYPTTFMALHGRVPVFEPVSKDSPDWPDLRAFCSEYRLNSIIERLEAGTLWAGGPPSTEGLFDDLDDTG